MIKDSSNSLAGYSLVAMHVASNQLELIFSNAKFAYNPSIKLLDRYSIIDVDKTKNTYNIVNVEKLVKFLELTVKKFVVDLDSNLAIEFADGQTISVSGGDGIYKAYELDFS